MRSVYNKHSFRACHNLILSAAASFMTFHDEFTRFLHVRTNIPDRPFLFHSA